MKILLTMSLAGILVFFSLFSQSVQADCGYSSSTSTYQCHSTYYKDTTPPSAHCTAKGDLTCSCTDPGYKWTTCMSKSKYCQVFGNIGAL